jgi:hypothetical protein
VRRGGKAPDRPATEIRVKAPTRADDDQKA